MLAISVISSVCRVLILGYMLMYASADSFLNNILVFQRKLIPYSTSSSVSN
jgi:hypothetical protein